MNKDDFLKEMAALLEVEGPLAGTESLNQMPEWDSLAVIGFITMLDKNFTKNISPEDIKECKTINDLYNMATKNGH